MVDSENVGKGEIQERNRTVVHITANLKSAELSIGQPNAGSLLMVSKQVTRNASGRGNFRVRKIRPRRAAQDSP
jgi:hypothetical protein